VIVVGRTFDNGCRKLRLETTASTSLSIEFPAKLHSQTLALTSPFWSNDLLRNGRFNAFHPQPARSGGFQGG
jgi:hypothetical protein